MRHAIRALVALLLLGTLAACGGDDGGSSVDAAPTTTEGQGDATTTTADDATTSSLDLGSGGGEFCDKARAQLAGGLDMDSPFMQSIMTGLMNPSQKAETRQKVRELVEENAALVDEAPAEIRASMETTVNATQSILSILEAADYDFSKVDISKITSVMTDPKFAQAARELETYFKDECGFDLGSLPSVPTTSG